MRSEAKNARRYMRSATFPESISSVPEPGRLIPKADVPVGPVLSWSTFGGDRNRPLSVLDAGEACLVKSGRIAIFLALRLMGISARQRILLPAYHCSAMVQPVIAIGAIPVFYRLNDDLSVNLADIESKIDAKTRALIVVHYFGFHQDMPTIRHFCDQRGLLLLEDCAHSFFGEIQGQPVGSFGDYAIASIWKFFPVTDGGCLIGKGSKKLREDIKPQHLMSQLRCLLQIAEDSEYYGRRGMAPIAVILRSMDRLRRLAFGANPMPRSKSNGLGAGRHGHADKHVGSEERIADCAMGESDTGMASVSCFVANMAAHDRAFQRRRLNYLRLADGISGLPGVRPLFSKLPNGVAPYLLPVCVDNLAEIFPKLEDAAVPMLRFGQFLWPDGGVSACKVSNRYAAHVVQFPCHQELWESEVDWIIERFRDCLRNPM